MQAGTCPPLTADSTDSGHPLLTPSSDAVLHRAAQGLPQLLHLAQVWGSLLVQTAVVCLAQTAHQSQAGPPVDHSVKSARARGARSVTSVSLPYQREVRGAGLLLCRHVASWSPGDGCPTVHISHQHGTLVTINDPMR